MKEVKQQKSKDILKKLFIKLCRFMGYEIIDQNNFYIPTSNKSLNETISKSGKKSISLPLGEVKISRKVKSLDVIIRTCSSVNMLTQSKKRIFEKNNCRFFFKDVRHSYLDTTADWLNEPLRKIYFSLPECKKENISVENGWIKSDDNEKNIKDIFEIPKSLDSESFDVHEATKELTSYWKNKALAKDCNEMMLKLMTLVKNNNEKLNLDTSFVSSNIYELF